MAMIPLAFPINQVSTKAHEVSHKPRQFHEGGAQKKGAEIIRPQEPILWQPCGLTSASSSHRQITQYESLQTPGGKKV